MQEIVSVEWLSQHLTDPDLLLLDASLPATAAGTIAHDQTNTIAGARFFDLKNCFSDHDSPFPNTLPSAQQFETECRKLGINNASKIVVFDNRGIYSSPRVWWMFKIMGHQAVSVLDGGLPEWVAHGLPVAINVTESDELGDFTAALQPQFAKSYQNVLDNLTTPEFCVVDARSAGRFAGSEPEPRKHLKSGSIPNSVNIPYPDVLANGMFKSAAELKTLFEQKCPNAGNLVFSCGSGLTACIVMLACEIGHRESRFVYDGSWSEWAERQGLMVKGLGKE